jgi:hypothetical protein
MGRGTTLLPACDLPRPPVRDQGAHSSCVAFAFSRALHIRGLVQGTQDVTPYSPAWIYWYGRRDPLVDAGMTLSAAFGVLSDVGCPDEQWCPYPLDDGRAPSDEASAHAWDQKGGFGARPLYGSHDALCALSLGYPIVIGTIARHGAPHATVLAGYSRDGYLREDNSWGPDWGLEGSVYDMPADYLDSSDVMGLWAVQWMPSPSERAQ